jgi:hypothetical protein
MATMICLPNLGKDNAIAVPGKNERIQAGVRTGSGSRQNVPGRNCVAEEKSPARGDGRGRRSLAGAADLGGDGVTTNAVVEGNIPLYPGDHKRSIGSAAMQNRGRSGQKKEAPTEVGAFDRAEAKSLVMALR